MTKRLNDRMREQYFREIHTVSFYQEITQREDRGKVCSVCETWQPYANFPRLRSKRDGFYAMCKECTSKKQSRSRRKAAYGMDDEHFSRLMQRQQSCCAICRTPHKQRPLVVDHCHKTERVRGLLCSNCNSGLGYFRDRSSFLLNAVVYLAHSSGYPNDAAGVANYLADEGVQETEAC